MSFFLVETVFLIFHLADWHSFKCLEVLITVLTEKENMVRDRSLQGKGHCTWCGFLFFLDRAGELGKTI